MIQTLIQAVISENVEKVEQLLKEGVDPNAFEDADKIRPLHFVAQKNSKQALQIARLLMLAGANPLLQNEPDKQTPLDIAKLMSSPKMVAVLLGTDEEQVRH